MRFKKLFKSRRLHAGFDKSAGGCGDAVQRLRSAALAVFLLLLVFGSLAAAPTGPIRGRVIDGKSGKPLGGASVTVRGKKNGTSTNVEGYFTLNIPDERVVLVVSSVGFTTTEHPVDPGASNVEIALAQDEKGMGEVIVTALGIQRTAKSLTYAAQRIGGEQLNEARDPSFANTLSGKVAGLTITPSSGGPGSPTRILLRGNRSIQGTNNALIVMDGVAIDNSTPAGEVRDDAGSTNAGQTGSDALSNINPDDIESVSVLKGAAGAALYGSRAANGVVIITTKRGGAGKMQVNLNSGIAADKALLIPDLQNEYSQGAGGVYSTLTGNSWGEKISGQTVTDWQGKSATLRAYPNNIRDFFRTAVSTNNAVSVNTGSDRVQTYLSYANNNADGIVPKNHLMRNTFTARFGVNITDKLSADAKISYINQNIYNKPGVGGDGLVGANVYRIPRTVSLDDLKNYKTTDLTGVETPTYYTTTDPVYMNPYWTIKRCWQLVETSERTKKHCMMTENCCYDFSEMLTLNMARQGFFGEIVHCEGGYIHNLTELMFAKDHFYQMWELEEATKRTGNLYPTHGLGPLCQVMNINRGDRMDYLVSMSSNDFSLHPEAVRLAANDPFYKPYTEKHFNGTMNTSTIRTVRGRTIVVQFDVSSPRPYSRIQLVCGTKATALKYPEPARYSTGEEWMSADEYAALEKKYTPPIVRKIGEAAKKVGGHGGMDFLMDWRTIDCLRNGLPLDQDVYDAALWSAVGPLSVWSVANRSNSINVPDFTGGAWKTNAPVDISLEKGANTKILL